MKSDPIVLLIGDTDAGKSNFLFRLWLAIEAQRGSVVSDGTPSDLEYLRAGALQLLGGEFAGKTSLEVDNQSIIPVKYTREGQTVRGKLVVPDCPGEQWLGIYKKRYWSQAWEDLISESCGCLVFVRADSRQIIAPLDWISYYKQFGTTIVPGSGANSSGPNEPAVPGEPPPTPTQVVLVDWVQCLKQAFTGQLGGSHRPRVGIVVTAWDLVPSDQQELGPMPWLDSNFPLLSQFLQASCQEYVFETFGISVVGGDLKDETFREQYRSGDPAKAGYVVFRAGNEIRKDPDVTLPVAWAMGQDLQAP